MVVAFPIADLVAGVPRAHGDLALLLDFGGDDVLPDATLEVEVEDVAVEAVEVGGAVAAVVGGGVAEELAGAPVVAGVGGAGAAGWVLALRAREGRRAHALGALVDGDAGATVQAVQVPTGAGVVLAGGTHESLRKARQGGVRTGAVLQAPLTPAFWQTKIHPLKVVMGKNNLECKAL